MACTMGSVTTLGTSYHIRLGLHVRLQSGCFLTPRKKKFQKLSYHTSARGKTPSASSLSASSVPSGAGDEGRPVKAGPNQGAMAVLLAAAGVVVTLLKLGSNALGTTVVNAVGNLAKTVLPTLSLPFLAFSNNTSSKYTDAKVDPLSKKLDETLYSIKGLDSRMKQEMRDFRGELSRDLGDFRGEMKQMRVESREDMAALQKVVEVMGNEMTSMKEATARLDGKIDGFQSSFRFKIE